MLSARHIGAATPKYYGHTACHRAKTATGETGTGEEKGLPMQKLQVGE